MWSPPERPPLALAIVALGVNQIIGWGTTFYLPAILSQAIAGEGLISKSHYLIAFSWCLVLAGMLSRRLGRLIDRVGAAPVLAVGSVVSAVGLSLQAHADSAWMIWLSWTSIGITLRAILYDGSFAALTALSGSQARRSISLLTLMGGLASTVFWPIGAWLVEWTDWRTTLLIYAALNLLVCAPLHWFFAGQVPSGGTTGRKSAPSSEGASPEAHAGASPGARTDALVGRASINLPPIAPPIITDPKVRERAILLFGAALGVHGFISYALSTHLPALLQGLGLNMTAAITVAALMGPAQVLARIVELRLQRSVPALSLTVPIFVLMPIAFIGFVLLPSVPAQQMAVAGAIVVTVWGASNGLMTIIRGALPIALFGTAGYGEVLGRLAAPTLYLGAIAPVLFALMIDGLGPVGATLTLFALGLASSALAWQLVKLSRSQAASSIQAC